MSGSKLSDASKPAPVRPDEPLSFSVHALPSPEQIADVDARRTRLGRWKMLGILLVCAAPVIASYFTYYVVRPEGRRVFGTLIEPARPLPSLSARTLAGASSPLSDLKGQWLLVSVSGGGCGTACEKHLYLQRQMREATGKEKERIDWVWLVSDDAPVADALRPALAKAIVLRVPGPVLAQWLQPEPGKALEDHLFVVDPMGNWMMRFPAGLDAAGAAKARRDIDRLLRASAWWDQAGR